jgi:hypothetical protein
VTSLATSGIALVCDGTISTDASGNPTCSESWEHVDIGVFGVFDPSVLSADDLGLMFFAGWAVLMTVFSVNWGIGKLLSLLT